jgi:hypothetical protein
MQIKTTLRLHLTPVRIAIIKNTTINASLDGEGKRSPYYMLLMGMYISATSMKSSMEVPQKT